MLTQASYRGLETISPFQQTQSQEQTVLSPESEREMCVYGYIKHQVCFDLGAHFLYIFGCVS